MTPRKAMIVGSTGLVGSHLLQNLFNNATYSEITALVRRTPLLKNHRKLKEVITDFSNIDKTLSTITANDVFCCLGTTIKKAGSQVAFRKVDYSLVVDVAKVMRKQGAEQFVVISAMGANSSSKVFYNRIKGDMEEALKGLGYPCLRIIRPSFVVGAKRRIQVGRKDRDTDEPVMEALVGWLVEKISPC